MNRLLSFLLPLVLIPVAFAQDKQVVEINGEKVLEKEYYRRMEYLPGLGRNAQGGFVEILPAFATLDALITEKLLLQIAAKKSVLPTDAEIDKEIAYRIKRRPSTLKDWKALGRTDAEYRLYVKLDLVQFRLQTEGVVVTDADVANLYSVSKGDRFTTPERMHLRVIMVKTAADQKLVNDGLKAGKSFAAMATLYSVDESRVAGGDYGEIPLTMLAENLRTALKGVKKGQQTKWINNADNKLFAIFHVADVLPEVVMPLDADMKDDLKRELALRKGAQKNDVSKMIRDARKSATINIASPEFDAAFKQFINPEKKAGG